MKTRKVNYDFLKCARKMPPLVHSTVKPFDITKSEVAQYLINCPEIMQKVFDMAQHHGIIEYDPDTEKWQGVDYDGD